METIFRLVLLTSLYASIVAIIIIILKAVLKNRISPKWHYLIWLVFILKLLIPFGPESKVSLFNAVPHSYQSMSFTQAYEQVQQNLAVKPEYTSNLMGTGDNSSIGITARTKTAASYIWFMGVILMAGWLLYTRHSLYRKFKKAGKASAQEIDLILEKCKQKAGVSKNIEIYVQDVIPTPAIIGVFRPKILLPLAVFNLNTKEISYILLHELAHYQRKDMLANYLLLVLQIIHWFNPVIWYCFRRIRQDMEVAADAKVLELLEGDEPREYGKALLTVLDSCNGTELAPRLIGMVDDSKSIENRIRMIKLAGSFKSKGRIVMAMGLFCILILSGVLLTNGLSRDDSVAKLNRTGPNGLQLKVLAYPQKYAMTSSNLPGIHISAQYSGVVDKVHYATTHGSLLIMEPGSGKTSNCGQNVELPYDVPVYWIPVHDSSLPKVTDKISVKVGILNKNHSRAEKQVNIKYDGSGYFNVQASPGIVFGDNDEIIKKHITNFLENGYSKYYIINSIKFIVWNKKINKDKLEATVFTTMNSNVPPLDPDTVPYIIQAKERAQKEPNAERKKILQKEYEILKNEYGKPDDANFVFKVTAKMKDNIIDEKSIELYVEQDGGDNKLLYIPAQDILPQEKGKQGGGGSITAFRILPASLMD